jgi:hypothetical protein
MHSSGGRRARAPVRAGGEHPGHMDLRSCENQSLVSEQRIHRRLLPKTIASSTTPAIPPTLPQLPHTTVPPQHAHQLQYSAARRASSPSFTSSPALAHQHHAQPLLLEPVFQLN